MDLYHICLNYAPGAKMAWPQGSHGLHMSLIYSVRVEMYRIWDRILLGSTYSQDSSRLGIIANLKGHLLSFFCVGLTSIYLVDIEFKYLN